MDHGAAHKYYSFGIRVGDTVKINRLVTNKYSIAFTEYLVIGVNLQTESFPCCLISNHGDSFFFSGYETI